MTDRLNTILRGLDEREALARVEAERLEREKAAADTTGVVMLPDTLGVRR